MPRKTKDVRVEYENISDVALEVVFSLDKDSEAQPLTIQAWEDTEDETCLGVLGPLPPPPPCHLLEAFYTSTSETKIEREREREIERVIER